MRNIHAGFVHHLDCYRIQRTGVDSGASRLESFRRQRPQKPLGHLASRRIAPREKQHLRLLLHGLPPQTSENKGWASHLKSVNSVSAGGAIQLFMDYFAISWGNEARPT